MNINSLIQSPASYSTAQSDDNFMQLPDINILSKRSGEHHLHPFFTYIQFATGKILKESERSILFKSVKIKKLRKRQYFLQQGDVCKYIGFISKGAAKMYSINARGHESIITLSTENDLVTDLESFWEETDSSYHIEALEQAELMLFERSQILFLLKAVPALNQMFCQLQMKQLIDFEKRIHASLSMSAEERYWELISSKPEYLLRFSQNNLAYYLGVKPQTLSRIRKR